MIQNCNLYSPPQIRCFLQSSTKYVFEGESFSRNVNIHRAQHVFFYGAHFSTRSFLWRLLLFQLSTRIWIHETRHDERGQGLLEQGRWWYFGSPWALYSKDHHSHISPRRINYKVKIVCKIPLSPKFSVLQSQMNFVQQSSRRYSSRDVSNPATSLPSWFMPRSLRETTGGGFSSGDRQVMRIKEDDQKFEITLNVHDYRPEELKVTHA